VNGNCLSKRLSQGDGNGVGDLLTHGGMATFKNEPVRETMDSGGLPVRKLPWFCGVNMGANLYEIAGDQSRAWFLQMKSCPLSDIVLLALP
jgi:hypothetical protein